ncbi:putative transcriptional regulator [Actinokineospora baliensis]|uniref:XRE family transcriptional regulator n=1 Tax=Actinokineospora baliensis TaxID=547056 RepID=UPI00195941DE|nr:XRE family transcriptional regulator [Actinokineospora baliensis]MBM7770762.1 putative transcriptional regulator [Actinokineospora baliensis]
MAEDWAAVARVITARLAELGWRQRELALRSQVSQAIIRELQYQTVVRRRSSRTLEALSVAMELHPEHLSAVLQGRRPLELGEVATEEDPVRSQLNVVETRLNEILARLDEMHRHLFDLARRNDNH